MAACGATISLLPVSLSLVHIPRSRIQEYIHPILRQILLPSPPFLNITSNEIELSIFTDHHALHELQSAAHTDARRHKNMSRERSAVAHDLKHKSPTTSACECIELCPERWNVLQIDSHSGGPDSSGARVHELSAPLAAAGISILYQSSYMSDFIFVKEYRLAEVMSLLGSVGFDLYQSDPDNLTSQVSALTSPVLSPLNHATDDDASIHLLDLTSTTPISTENGAVLTRSRSGTNTSSGQSGCSSPSLSRRRSLLHPDETVEDPSTTVILDGSKTVKPALARSLSHSPSGCEVTVLDPDLTCIGLSDDNADVWGLKIIKLVAYPDLIPVPQPQLRPSPTQLMLDADELAPVSELGVQQLLVSALDTSCEPETDSEAEDTEQPSDTDTDAETESEAADSMTRVGDSSPVDSRASSQSPIFDMDEDDSPRRREVELESDPSSDDDEQSLYASPAAFPLELADIQPDEIEELKQHARSRRPQLPHLDTEKTTRGSAKHRQSKRRPRRSLTSLSPPRPPPPLVPFFSFTRTPEGSSLTAPVNLLAALFPPSERHMVICSDELDELDSRAGSPVPTAVDDDDDDEQEQGGEAGGLADSGTLKCLQINLTRFGLGIDKHGLINRYSRALEDNGINHMYSSTYKTANLLVDKAHARRAQALLRSC